MPPEANRIPWLEAASFLDLFHGTAKVALESQLLDYLEGKRWFRSKSRLRVSGKISEVVPVPGEPAQALLLFDVEFAEGAAETYLIALADLAGAEALAVRQSRPHSLIAERRKPNALALGELYDGLASGSALTPLLRFIAEGAVVRGTFGELSAKTSSVLEQALAHLPAPQALEFEQTNSTVSFGEQFVLKVYRQVAAGQNPELELGEFMTQFPNVPGPRVLGSLTLLRSDAEPRSLGLVQEFVPNRGTAWQFTLTELEAYFERASALGRAAPPPLSIESWRALAGLTPDPLLAMVMGAYPLLAAVLGRRTAEVHRVLASGSGPGFEPEPFTMAHQRAICRRAQAALVRVCAALGLRGPDLRFPAQALAARVVAREAELSSRFERILQHDLRAKRARCHGDLHLGQVLFTGNDFVLIDFEGEPARPLAERRDKQSPLRDVMSMIRSFDYATEAVLRSGQNEVALRPWANVWKQQVSAAFLRGYLDAAGDAAFIPETAQELDTLLDFYELEKTVYEVTYELDNRPEWLPLPLAGIETICARGASGP